MGRWRDGVLLRWVSRVVAAVIIVLNIALLWLTLSGQG